MTTVGDVAEYRQMDINEYGWVIERYIESQLHYWSGWPKDSGRDFTPEHFNAIRFARECDAMMVLSHLCDGVGRVAQHGWIGGPTGNRNVRIAGTARECTPAQYYCPEHKYNPPPNSGIAICPQCEIIAGNWGRDVDTDFNVGVFIDQD